jgi:ATPase subunit of ABC transporter with duplicated ATPase domains
MLLASFAKVSKDFGGNPVLHEIDFEIIEGERIGLVGENGGGKSTLLRFLTGLAPASSPAITRKNKKRCPLRARRWTSCAISSP